MRKQTAKEKLREVLRKKEKAVWDATSLRKDFRSVIIGLTQDYGGLVTTIFFHSTVKESQKANNNRDRTVAASIIDKQLRAFEYPTLDESDRQLIVNQKGERQFVYGFHDSFL